MDDQVPKADGFKYAEIRSQLLVDSKGGRPVRKRGFYRALKRREAWAVLDAAITELCNKACRELFK